MYLRQCIRTREYVCTLLKNHPLFRQTKQNQFTLCAKINGSIIFDKISVEIGLYDLVYTSKSSPKNDLNQVSKLLKLFWENLHQLFIFTQIFVRKQFKNVWKIIRMWAKLDFTRICLHLSKNVLCLSQLKRSKSWAQQSRETLHTLIMNQMFPYELM